MTPIERTHLRARPDPPARRMLRDLNAHIEAAREKERTRIARELHDELGQTLTSIKLELAWISGRLGAAAAPVRDRIGAAEQQIDAAIRAVRRISSQLRPGLLDDLGLPAALNWQAREFEHTSGVRCHLSLRTGDATPNRDLATALFRIFQEALTNVARHAQARAVRAALVATRREWVLKITDNGRGISAEAIRSATSLGLLGMQERVRRRGGRVEIKRVRPHGTRVEVRIPRES